jgi:hypothetical protein
MFGVEVTEDGKYLIITIQESCERSNRFYYVDLNNIKKDEKGFYIFFIYILKYLILFLKDFILL